MPLSGAVRPGYAATPTGSNPEMYGGAPMVSASGSVNASASTQATGVLIIVLVVAIIVAERWLR